MAEQAFEMVRYADDFVILCKTAEEAAWTLEIIKQWVADNGLSLPPTKTRVVDTRTGRFDFLGYTFSGENHWPRQKSLEKLRDTIRARTRRTSGDSMQYMVAGMNPVFRDWVAYFQHSTYRNVFTDVDGYVRRRLRDILDKRTKRRGAGRGLARQRWPNHFFAEQGCSVCQQPMPRPFKPRGGKTINRRAVCGRSASTVRSEGGPNDRALLPPS
jgi:RNA-directed DNA polymerase